MTESSWTIRDVSGSDADLLAGFRCAGDQEAYSVEVQDWVRTDLVRWVTGSIDRADPPGGVLLIEDDSGAPIAVSAFEPGHVLVIDGVHVPAVRLQVLAVGDDWQGVNDSDGVRFSTRVVRATLQRIAVTWPEAPVTALVDAHNVRSASLLRSAGFSVDLPHPTREGYRVFIRPAAAI